MDKELSKNAENASSANLTAVEWLACEIGGLDTGVSYHYFAKKVEEAKEMEKENTIAFADKYDAYVVRGGTLTARQYYNKTYGGEND
jgi:hypothetical protein